MTATATLTIGELASRAGVGVETIRFYERRGLLAEPERGRSGYRQYSLAAVQRVRFIRQAKELGFTLKEIHELLELGVDPRSSCADVRERAQAKIAEIEERIGSLVQVKAALQRMVEKCDDRESTSDCPILDELAGTERSDATS
jgi:Hg(II)-responsive transcriptional regulator